MYPHGFTQCRMCEFLQHTCIDLELAIAIANFAKKLSACGHAYSYI